MRTCTSWIEGGGVDRSMYIYIYMYDMIYITALYVLSNCYRVGAAPKVCRRFKGFWGVLGGLGCLWGLGSVKEVKGQLLLVLGFQGFRVFGLRVSA